MLLIGLALAMDGQTAWVEGDPVAAASAWADRIDAGEIDGDLYYNLGNALYVQGRTPEAMVAWRRAQLLSPRDGDIGANLQHARRQSLDRIEAPAPSNPLSPREMGLLAALVFAMGGALGFRFPRVGVAVTGVAAVLALLTGLQLRQFGQGAVLLTSSDVKSAGGGGVTLFELNPGAEVLLEQQVGSMSQIALPDGRRGWLPAAALGIVDPRLEAPR